ncbi:MAG: DNA recombination protein RmuC [Desulfatiglandaceae bacterium]
MAWVPIFLALLAGFVLGLVVAFVLRIIQSRTAKQLADELFQESEVQRKANIEAIMDGIKANFGNLSLEALSKSTEQFLVLAKSKLDMEREVNAKELDAKKGLIDEQLKQMTAKLENVSGLVQRLEMDRVEKFGELASQLKSAGEQTAALMQTTNSLREAFVSTKVRGQWGERMAEDVLRMAGLIENVNYQKQKSLEGVGTRPDFTFFLPRDLRLNMDVKFPLDNYMRFLEAQSEIERPKFRNDFLRDVKARIKEVTTRDYINPEQNTLDYVLLFIPNEAVYAFIHRHDSSILDNALKNKVVLCSPITLFAILAVIRQAVDNFALEQTSNEILSLLGAFKKQWHIFLNRLEVLGKRIGDAQKEYEALTTTRVRQLERPLNKIEELRTQRKISSAPEYD